MTSKNVIGSILPFVCTAAIRLAGQKALLTVENGMNTTFSALVTESTFMQSLE